MIPDLPQEISESARDEFYATLAGNLADQSSIHVNWHTHRQNPAVCWICDMNVLLARAFPTHKYNTKSSLDKETRLSSDDDSDTEIESVLNQPEYDTVADVDQSEDS